MAAYYNEIDPFAAQWLRNLVAAGQIAAGDVDQRSITDVRPDDLNGYTQCHFFAGIGGWSYALRLAGWPDDRPVWTGSCPCQPFSVAGKQRGSEDDRHLWPAFFRLIRECRPASVFGEQVAGAAGLAWLDHVCADLEDAGYAAAAANLGAHSVGAPHIRQRLYWVAHANGRNASAERQQRSREQRQQPQDGGAGILGNTDTFGSPGRSDTGSCEGMGQPRAQLAGAGADGLLADTAEPRLQGREPAGQRVDAQRSAAERASAFDAWGDLKWLQCSDGKARPTQPGLFPLAHGVSNRVGRLRAYGNAIVPQLAAVFVMATT
jgi:DNA (cytosine-5)-methyltransferase 1